MGHAAPLFARFKTEHNCYIYDANSNEILRVSRAAWEIAEDYLAGRRIQADGSLSQEEVESAVAELADGRDKGYLLPCDVQEMCFYDGSEDAIGRAVTSRLSQLSLEVTEACNYRCRYCAFTYATKRTSAPTTMRRQTAFRAVDLFFQNSADAKKKAVTFWGGEPLLNHALIRGVTEYVAECHPRERVRYSFTTNGSLLTEEHIAFLVENNFLLTISLDGPRKVHDRNRVTVGGDGTFDRLMRGLDRVRAKDENYYRESLSFHCVITPGTSLSELIPFFESAYCRGHFIKTTIVAKVGTPFDATLSPEQLTELATAYETAAVRGSHTTIVRELLDPRMLQITRRSRERLGQSITPNGCCVPLMKALHVAADGTIHLCEKVDHSSPLGNVNDGGIDLPAVLGLVRLYSRNSLPACRSCFALRLCGLCYQGSVHGHAWRPDSPSRCDEERRAVHRGLWRYASILERNPSAFDAFWDYEITAPM